MGRKCYWYHLYYLGSFVIFLLAGILGVALLASVSSQCVKVCPLAAPDGTPCNVQEGVCMKGSGGCVDKSTMYQHEDVDKLRANFNDQCFVCINGDVYWPKFKSAGTLKWVPAAGCTTMEGTGGQDPDTAEELCWSVPSEMGLRALAVPVLWLTAILYILQAVGTIVCSMGMKHFATKYSQDWKKLGVWEVRLGVLVKVFPRINRVFNLGVLTMLILLIYMVFLEGVCYDVVNDYGERAFFPAASLYTTLVIVIFSLTCVGGTVFRRAVPFETPFYQPRMRPDDSKKFAYFCWEPTCFTMGILGP